MFNLRKSKLFFYAALFFLSDCWLNLAYAVDQSPSRPLPPSLGGASANALEPLGIFTNALYSICYILGAGFIMSSIIRFKEYRENPSQTPISRPIAVLIFGLIFLAIPFIARLSQSSSALR